MNKYILFGFAVVLPALAIGAANADCRLPSGPLTSLNGGVKEWPANPPGFEPTTFMMPSADCKKLVIAHSMGGVIPKLSQCHSDGGDFFGPGQIPCEEYTVYKNRTEAKDKLGAKAFFDIDGSIVTMTKTVGFGGGAPFIQRHRAVDGKIYTYSKAVEDVEFEAKAIQGARDQCNNAPSKTSQRMDQKPLEILTSDLDSAVSSKNPNSSAGAAVDTAKP